MASFQITFCTFEFFEKKAIFENESFNMVECSPSPSSVIGCILGYLLAVFQGVEHSSANILYFELAKKLYPNSGYNVETGGYLQNLRNSTSIAKVRDYHKKYYRPENLVLTITGRIDEQELFETLQKTEEKVLRKRAAQPAESFQRPWQTPLVKINLTEDLIFEIEYPSDDETTG
jgi:predicted Zn-dependent peptidase